MAAEVAAEAAAEARAQAEAAVAEEEEELELAAEDAQLARQSTMMTHSNIEGRVPALWGVVLQLSSNC
eukprot:1609978-Prymnesium_polylepis.1